MEHLQHAEFVAREADAWFERNAHSLVIRDDDPTLEIILSQPITGKKILDIGCSLGHRLARLAAEGAECHGIDPSKKAILAGNLRYPSLNLRRGVSHVLDYEDEAFDIVYLVFVLHWIDRFFLLRTVAEIDRVLKGGGRLIISDFYPDKPRKNPYHHRTDVALFTYKQRYWDIFTAAQLYDVARTVVYRYDDVAERNPALGDNTAAVVELIKRMG